MPRSYRFVFQKGAFLTEGPYAFWSVVKIFAGSVLLGIRAAFFGVVFVPVFLSLALRSAVRFLRNLAVR